MDLGQLKYFCKIVEHRSFTKAAHDCSVSQPALSQQISKLERELGQPLFERQGRSIRLTPAGQLLHSQAERILQLAEEAKKQITDDGETGQICISAIPTIAPYLLPTILEHTKSLFPKANFVINEDTTSELLKRCSNGDVDVGILALPATSKYVTVEPLFEEELLVAMSAENPLSKKRQVTPADLDAENVLILRDTHCLAEITEPFCQSDKFQPVSASRIEQLTTVQMLISRGHGVSLIPKMATAVETGSEIAYRSLKGSPPTRTIAICFNSHRYQSRLLCKFIAAAKELCSTDAAIEQKILNRVDQPHSQPSRTKLRPTARPDQPAS